MSQVRLITRLTPGVVRIDGNEPHTWALTSGITIMVIWDHLFFHVEQILLRYSSFSECVLSRTSEQRRITNNEQLLCCIQHEIF